jgi:tetratricopeptide (TPR) repeat protein
MNSKSGQSVIDTAIIYNTGLAAYKAQNWDKAIEYFSQSAKYDYNGPASYNFTYKSYLEKQDTLNYLKTVKEAFQTYPTDETILVELINFYISKGKSEDAIKYIDLAINDKPNNASLYTAKGSMLEKMGNVEEAIKLYKNAIAVDSSQFAPYYNLSVIFYNRGVELINTANQLPPTETAKYEQNMENAKIQFRESLPYIEKAYSIDPSEMAILESLKTVYYRLQMTEKYQEINKKIQSLKQ